MNRYFLLSILIFTLTVSCSSNAASDSPQADSAILTSTTLLADIARNVAGDHATIDSMLPIGADPHSYQPTPQDMAKIENSPLLILNGAEYEHFLEPFLANNKKQTVITTTGINLRKNDEGVDPHAWLDPNHAVVYVENIRDGLIQLDPPNAEIYKSNAAAYVAELKNLDIWIKEQVAQIPAEKKLLITNHEALGYFAERYGFTVAGSVIPSFSSNAAPSAQQMAGLIDEINALGVSAIFLDAADNDALANQIASETGAMVISDLHLESLTEGAPAATYIDLMKHNVTRIVEALK